MRNNRRKRFNDSLFNDIADEMFKEIAENKIEKVKSQNEKMMIKYDFFISNSRKPEEEKLKARIMQEEIRLKDFLFSRLAKACMPGNRISKSKLRAILTIIQELYDKAVDLFEELDFFDGER